MNWRISDLLSADCGYMYGKNWNLQDRDIQKAMPSIRQAVNDVETIRRDGKGPTGELVLFPHLPYILSEDLLMDEKERQQLAKLEASATSIDVVVSIGIGGSYLGTVLEHGAGQREAVAPGILCRAECRSGKSFRTYSLPGRKGEGNCKATEYCIAGYFKIRFHY